MRRMNSWTANKNSLLKKTKKHVKVKNAYAHEVEKCENLTKELSICHDSITNLRNENASLNVKIDKLNESISSFRTENDSLISKAKELNVCNDSISYDRTSQVIRPTYICPCSSDLRQPCRCT
jgi:chromosome segregation ATPase